MHIRNLASVVAAASLAACGSYTATTVTPKPVTYTASLNAANERPTCLRRSAKPC